MAYEMVMPYHLHMPSYFLETFTEYPYFNDIDGEENGGAFKSDSVLIKDMNQKKLEEGGHWYVGKFEFSPKGSIKLSKKEKNRED